MTAAASVPPWSPIVALGTAAVAAALVIARWLAWGPNAASRPQPGQRVGPGNWSFNDSWASTLTAFGAVIGGILASNVLPAQGRYVSVQNIVLLNIVFGFLVVLAPFVYTATGVKVIVPGFPPGTPPTVGYEGTVITFLIASAMTLWAALGEVGTMALAAAELSHGGTVFYVVAIVLLIVSALMLTYVWRSIRWVLDVQATHQAMLATTAMAGPPPPRPRWTFM